MRADIVVGLGFGDEGKGITTDYRCSKTAIKKVVVRFSGGQQAGHNVEINGVNHIHSSFGSGTLRGVPSYFSEHCTIYPLTLYNEYREFKSKGITPDLTVHPLAMVTTPGDIAYNRLMEKKRGHGSCGLGVGETMKRNINTGYKLYAIDLVNNILLEEKFKNIYWYYRGLLSDDDVKKFNEYYTFEHDAYMKSIKKLCFKVQGYSYLKNFGVIIFEGSQGVLLDMDHGIFPHVTYANTTSKNALEICKKLEITDIEIYYPTRCYQTRHGAGWMSNRETVELINNEKEINTFNEWQKEFKIGEIDYDLINYALEIDNLYSEGITKNLVVTCLDQRPGFEFKYELLNTTFKNVFESYSPDSKNIHSVDINIPVYLP